MKCVLCGKEAYIAAFDADDAICDECQNKAWRKESIKLKQISGKIGVEAIKKLNLFNTGG